MATRFFPLAAVSQYWCWDRPGHLPGQKDRRSGRMRQERFSALHQAPHRQRQGRIAIHRRLDLVFQEVVHLLRTEEARARDAAWSGASGGREPAKSITD